MQLLKKMRQGALAAMAVAVASALTLGAGVANADTPTGPGNMPTTQGTITIHKHKEIGSTTALNPDGTSQAPADPLGGVEFTVTKVEGIDLNKNADWAKISTLNAKTITRGAAQKVTTADNGTVTTSSLDIGVYLVEETGTGTHAITSKAAPFFVTIPLPFQNKWITNVHVYPKNVVKTPGTKEVTNDTNTHKVGDVLEWTMTTTATTANPSAYGIVDQLESYLDYVNGSAKVFINDQEVTDITVTPGTTPAKHVKITVNDAARQQITAGATVKFVLQTTVTTMPENGIVKNGAWPIDNEYNPFENQNPGGDTPPIIPTKDPYFGDYKFKKVDSNNTGKALAGATFGLFQCDGNAVTGDAIVTATSGADGVVAFNGIYLGTFTKGTAQADAKKTLCLKETEAPAGYILSETVKQVEITAGHVADNATLDEVRNTPQNGPDLPLTGAAGTMVMTLAGVALLVAGAALYVTSSRSRQRN
ncbi:SpaH/EbpB family LPXTG-anchored major pilin [Schaalia sp. ZJ405]|uniref:SpaH/EbpB family LPXTG-anchored major pilin n=1 Tax=Schaalia sp. ZJ405 TaxID=2709403 RepID=UPI0013EC9B3B|nr:SpaH/EbpB family LPXTG-anchored major pilin [Schaalia sp. ZJ405]QPK80748.1 SpaH/EbpB family LPXTG-anchored major pilin [Schaalia sp. ZJ405]